MPRKAGNPITNKKYVSTAVALPKNISQLSPGVVASSSFYVTFPPVAPGSAPWQHRSAPTPPSGTGKGSRKAEEDKASRQTTDAMPYWVNTKKRQASHRDVERLGREFIIRSEVNKLQCSVGTLKLLDHLRATTTQMDQNRAVLLQQDVCIKPWNCPGVFLTLFQSAIYFWSKTVFIVLYCSMFSGSIWNKSWILLKVGPHTNVSVYFCPLFKETWVCCRHPLQHQEIDPQLGSLNVNLWMI